tara:strand:- start:5441 stop:7177 length:1737 start_codon:yes stop_codon:yes gene_type:complete
MKASIRFNLFKEQNKLIKSLLLEINSLDFFKLLSFNFIFNLVDLFSISFVFSFIFNSQKIFPFVNLESSKLKVFSFIIILFLLRSLLSIFIISEKENIHFSFYKNLKNNLFLNFINSSKKNLEMVNNSDFLSVINLEIERTSAALNRSINFIQSFFSVLIYLIAIILIGKNNVIFIILSFFAVFVSAIIYKSKSWRLGELESQENIKNQKLLIDGFNSLKVIKANNAENWFVSNFIKQNTYFINILKKNILRTTIFNSLKEFFTILFVTLWLLFNKERFLISEISLILIFSMKLSNFSGTLISNYREIINLLPGYKNLIIFREKINFSKDIKKISSLHRNSYQFKDSLNSLAWECEGYQTNKGFLKICLKKDNPLVVIGYSGSGKTLFLDSFCGLQCIEFSKWKLSFNNKKEKILYGEKGSRKFRSNISYLTQNSQLFELTIKQNILLNKYDANLYNPSMDNEIKDWLVKLNLFKLIERYGLDNRIIKSTLDNLSKGEIQRLLLIRSFILNKPIEVFDEPLAGLDKLNANIVTEIFSKRAKNKIILISSHNENLINSFNNILRVETLKIKNNNLYTNQ